MLRELNVSASCSVRVNVHVNGPYDGLAGLTESIDSFFLKQNFPSNNDTL